MSTKPFKSDATATARRGPAKPASRTKAPQPAGKVHAATGKAPAVGRPSEASSGPRIADFVALYRADPVDRIRAIKAGVPATEVGSMARRLAMPQDRLTALLGMAPSTVSRKARTNAKLALDEGGRLLGVQRLVGQVAEMVEQSGDPTDFDAGQWVSRWIETPVPALGNRKPAEFLDTTEGQALVSSLIARMQSGAYT